MIFKNKIKYLAIIPARKGSKGLPNKNLMPFVGRPLFQNTYDILMSSKYNIDIYVSTDSEEIISICKENNLNFIRRPDNLSNDNSTTEDAISHLLSNVELSMYDTFILAQCTSPLILSSDVNEVLSVFESKSKVIDSLFTCYEDHFPIWINKENNLSRVNHLEQVRQPRQKTNPLLIENGALYVFKIKEYLKLKSRFCGNIEKFVMPKYRSIDIDNLSDFRIAEFVKKNNVL
jgi:CMP-N-acetylneuraminic acid synthetase